MMTEWATCDKHGITHSRSYGCYRCRFDKESAGLSEYELVTAGERADTRALALLDAYRTLTQAVKELLEAEDDGVKGPGPECRCRINLGVYRLSVAEAIDIIHELKEA